MHENAATNMNNDMKQVQVPGFELTLYQVAATTLGTLRNASRQKKTEKKTKTHRKMPLGPRLPLGPQGPTVLRDSA